MLLKLERYIRFEATLVCKTGLRIGGSREDVEIGGLDNPIIRDPVTKLPYIPGSSLKGKLRSLLEYRYCADEIKGGEPCGCARDNCPVCRLFGPHKKPSHELGPTRIIVRDASLSDESKENLERLLEEGLEYTEIKTENIIDRRTGVAARGGLRTMERIPAGAMFNLKISLRVFQGDNELNFPGGKSLKDFVSESLDMMQQDYLGGSGTRGYGWVKIENLKTEEQ